MRSVCMCTCVCCVYVCVCVHMCVRMHHKLCVFVYNCVACTYVQVCSSASLVCTQVSEMYIRTYQAHTYLVGPGL